MNYHHADFPYAEIRDENDDFFSSAEECMNRVICNADHVWSIVEGDRENVWIYGPSHHFVNVIGFIATEEAHDGETYFEEHWS